MVYTKYFTSTTALHINDRSSPVSIKELSTAGKCTAVKNTPVQFCASSKLSSLSLWERRCFHHQMLDLYKKWTDTRQMKSECKPCSRLDIHSESNSCSRSGFGSGSNPCSRSYLCSGSNSCKRSSLCSDPDLTTGATFAAGPAFTPCLRGLLTY